MKVRIARSGRRHLIGNAHILAALESAGRPRAVRTPLGMQLHFIGPDDRGIELHIIAIPDDRNPDGMTVIHAMPTSYTQKGGQQ